MSADVKLIELFAGLGSQSQALKNIGVKHQVVGISEIDKFAIQSYKALHGEVKNYGDICNIDRLPKADMWTYSFPCQDISLAGKLAGFDKESGTRSGLLWQVARLLEISNQNNELPKFLLLENVKNLVGKKFKASYDEWLAFLNGLGYTNYWQVLNAKHYGVPQNRERVFCISVRGDHKPYVFPERLPLELKLKDYLDEIVDEKYYISDYRIKAMMTSTYVQRRNSIINKDIVPSLCARDWKEPKCVLLGEIDNEKYNKMLHSARRVYSGEGVAPTIHTCPGGNTEPKVAIGAIRGRNSKAVGIEKDSQQYVQQLELGGDVANSLTTVQKDNLVVCEHRYDIGLRMNKDSCVGTIRTCDAGGKKLVLKIKSNTKKGYEEATEGDSVNFAYWKSNTRRGRVGKEVSQTLTSGENMAVALEVEDKLTARKLTERECLRLMGWKDCQIDKIVEAKTSKTQMYKQAGNGIVVDVLEAIFKNLL